MARQTGLTRLASPPGQAGSEGQAGQDGLANLKRQAGQDGLANLEGQASQDGPANLEGQARQDGLANSAGQAGLEGLAGGLGQTDSAGPSGQTERKVLRFMEQYNMVGIGDRVLIGLSGGADSVALFHILCGFQGAMGFRLLAVHVNHGLRGEEAQRDQAFVDELCKRHGVACRFVESPVRQLARERKIGLEEAGRVARRQAFQACAREWGCARLALAHHKNDQAETMLHHLARGTGLTGLAGFPPTDGFRIRPLLCLKREEIDHYLQERGFPHVEDSSNQEDAYTRNRIRHEILPVMEGRVNGKAVEHMAQAAELLRQADTYLAGQGERLLGKYQRQDFLEDAFFREDPVPVAYALRKFLASRFTGMRDVGFVHYGRLREWANMSVGKILQLPHGIRARREYGGISFYLEQQGETAAQEGFSLPLEIPGEAAGQGFRIRCRVFPNKFQQIPQKTYTKWVNYDKIKSTVEVRTRLPGDYLVVNAFGGKKKLKEFFINCKVPRQERSQVVLVAQGSEVLWVVGYRLNDAYKIRPDTREILELIYEGG